MGAQHQFHLIGHTALALALVLACQSSPAEETGAADTASPAAQTQPEDYSPFTPYGRQFALMREELARYQALAQADNWQPLPDGQALAPGVRDSRVAILRGLLMQYGDYPLARDNDQEHSEAVAAVDEYDAVLQSAVERFQRRHGLKPDGLVDGRTRAQLNVNPASRAQTLAANLERWQRMPKDLGPRYILVNIPEFTLRLMQDEREQYRMRVVVGKPKHKTPQLTSRLTRVVFNPTWTVPPSIAVKELLPKGSANLAAGGYRLVNHRGKSVPFTGHNIAAVRLGSVALQQRGGEGNALGRFKFVIPNQHAIFLHDTNMRHLFKRSQRAFSHGCIRLEEPFEFAHLMLGQQRGRWDEEKITRMVDGGRTRAVEVQQPIPVYIAYWTAWVDEQGQLQFRPDIYGYDNPAAAETSDEEEQNSQPDSPTDGTPEPG